MHNDHLEGDQKQVTYYLQTVANGNMAQRADVRPHLPSAKAKPALSNSHADTVEELRDNGRRKHSHLNNKAAGDVR